MVPLSSVIDMAKAKDQNSEGLSTGGTEKRKSIKSIKAKGLAFPETISRTPAPPKAKATKTKSKKKAVILVDSSVEGSEGEEDDEDEDLKIE
jgi:hypothetical protein